MPWEATGAQISILINFNDLKKTKNIQIYTFNCLDSVCTSLPCHFNVQYLAREETFVQILPVKTEFVFHWISLSESVQ